jgi:hypothetical protein
MRIHEHGRCPEITPSVDDETTKPSDCSIISSEPSPSVFKEATAKTPRTPPANLQVQNAGHAFGNGRSQRFASQKRGCNEETSPEKTAEKSKNIPKKHKFIL